MHEQNNKLGFSAHLSRVEAEPIGKASSGHYNVVDDHDGGVD